MLDIIIFIIFNPLKREKNYTILIIVIEQLEQVGELKRAWN